MKSRLIVMLTQNDVTVSNARAIFESCANLPVEFWGFKDVGIQPADARSLVQTMKDRNKTTVLEVVTYTEEACLENARLAVDCGFEYLTGTKFFPSVAEFLKDKPIRYFPFVGDVGGSPVTLKGSTQNILDDCARLEQAGVHGLDLVAYRFANGDPVDLAKKVVAAADIPVIMAGSISSVDRLRIVHAINPFAFTIGSALFEGRFLPGGDFRANLESVINSVNAL